MPKLITPLRSVLDSKAEAKGFYYDPAEAARACRFFEEFLVHSKGDFAGQPFLLQLWQRDYFSKLYGWKRSDGTRRFRKAYSEIPKKNGKTTMAAGVALKGLVADRENGAEVALVAVDRNQAGTCYKEASLMVQASPSLARKIQPVPHLKRLEYAGTNSSLFTLSKEVDSREGLNLSTLVIDELHAWKNPQAFNVLRYAGRSRKQPLLYIITTAGFDRQSICYREREYALDVESGQVEDFSVFVFIRCADPADDYKDPAVWYKANPSLGITIPFESFELDAREAFERPAEVASWQRYSLNIWTGAETSFIPPEKWAACNLGEIDWADHHGEPSYAGLDLSSVNDISALCLLIGNERDGYKLLRRFFVPGEFAAHREARDKVPYSAWERAGHVIFTGKRTIDFGAIKAEVLRLHRLHPIKRLLCDPYNAAQLLAELEAEGILVEQFGQGILSMSPPTKELERLTLEEKINHEGDPVLEWMASNAKVISDNNGNIRLVKPTKDSPKKIDGMIALIEAIAGALEDATEDAASTYEENDLLVL